MTDDRDRNGRRSDWQTAIDHLRELFEQRFESLDRALLLQATEYERRLESLNHEAARISAAAEKSVSAEKFDGFVKAQELQNSRFSEYMAQRGGHREGNATTIAYLVTAASLLFGLVGVTLAIITAAGGA